MQIALTLLISAFQLLTLVSNSPNLPQSFRDNAFQIANTAIAYAQATIANPEVTPPAPVVTPITPISLPVLGSTQTLTNQTQNAIIAPMDHSELKATVTKVKQNNSDEPFGVYFIKIEVLDTNGKNVNSVSVSMEAQDNFYGNETAKIDSVESLGSKLYFHTFSFQPTSTGSKTLTFSSGSLTKSLVVEVN